MVELTKAVLSENDNQKQALLGLLAEYFALNMTRELKREYFAGFSPQAMKLLTDYHWPGNVRELKNVIERNVYRSGSEELIQDINFNPFASPWRLKASVELNKTSTRTEDTDEEYEETTQPSVNFPIDLKEASQEYEIKLIKDALKLSQFNQKKTADLLKLTYHQLRGYLKKYQLLD